MIEFSTVESEPSTETVDALWNAYRNEGVDCMDQLIQAYLPFVYRVLKRIAIRLPSHISQEDLAQVALMGLYKSIVDYNPDRGIPFEGYAHQRIRGSILDELRSNDRLSRGKRAKVDQVEKMIAEWMRTHDQMPTEDEISSSLGMTLQEFHQLMDEAKPLCSLDAGDDEHHSLSETLADPGSNSEEAAQTHDMQKLLREGFKQLDMREQKILYLYYFEDLRLCEIAELFQLTEARISQIHALSVMRLRAALTAYFPDEFTSHVA